MLRNQIRSYWVVTAGREVVLAFARLEEVSAALEYSDKTTPRRRRENPLGSLKTTDEWAII